MQKIKNFFNHLWINLIHHKILVLWLLLKFCIKLMWRALIHDWTKITPIELDGFVGNIHKLKTVEFGSKEYQETLKSLGPSLKHHYKSNPHHPEYYFKEGEEVDLSRMDLVSLVEMFYDWQAAVKKHKTGDPHRSLEVNKIKFKISKDLESIFKNSIK